VSAEIELKLAIDPARTAATVAAVLRHPAVAAVRRGRVRKTRVVSTYYDTPDWRLAADRIALRVRRDGARWLQTVKGPPLAQAGGALHARGEYEWPLAGPRLDPVRLATTPWRRALGRALARGDLEPRFTTDFERRTLPLAFADDTRATLCIDVGVVRAARPRGAHRAAQVPVAEVEIELSQGNPARLFELAAALAGTLPLPVATVSKATRGQALVRGEPDGWSSPVRAEVVALPAHIGTSDALRRIAVECVRQIAGNAAGLLHDDDPEWVHQMRVGTRRLRACLGLTARVVAPAQLAVLRTEAKALARVLGRARDWDVFVEETLPAAAAHHAANPDATAIVHGLAAHAMHQRDLARAAVREAVRAPWFQQLLLAAGWLCSAPDFDPAHATPARGARNLAARDFARKVLRRRHRSLQRRAAACADDGAEARHALRIAAKKLRYAAEFFAPLFPRRGAAGYAKALAGLQDVLGRGNDAATAARLERAIATGAGDAPGPVCAWAAATASALEPRLADAWQRLADAKRFWRGPRKP
jgi:triphosphatase